jgi:hypothetical protein
VRHHQWSIVANTRRCCASCSERKPCSQALTLEDSRRDRILCANERPSFRFLDHTANYSRQCRGLPQLEEHPGALQDDQFAEVTRKSDRNLGLVRQWQTWVLWTTVAEIPQNGRPSYQRIKRDITFATRQLR